MDHLTAEQQALWQRVTELWELSRSRDEARIRAMLHPDYAGWDMTAPLPHDREAAVRSVRGDAAQLGEYELQPLSVRIYDRRVGVVHYRYAASVAPKDSPPVRVTGKWTEVYLRKDEGWLMLAVSGQPDAGS